MHPYNLPRCSVEDSGQIVDVSAAIKLEVDHLTHHVGVPEGAKSIVHFG